MRLTAIEASATWPLRQSILRPHQPLSEMEYPGDEAPSTRHFGAWKDERLMGIASLYREDLCDRPRVRGWRLRGMAVVPESRRLGVGASLVQACAAHAGSEGGELLWCNAREGALAFYRRLGFETLKGPFEIPGIGTHFVLTLPLPGVDQR
jgi:GNAT superfamily N-acetyltransferase